MRILIQRVSRAEVRVGDRAVGGIAAGVLVFVGVAPDDTNAVADALARKVAELRIFADEAGLTNRSLLEVEGAALVVSQFTLLADTSRGRRPGFTGAARGPEAAAIYERVVASLRSAGVRKVETGQFGAEMAVELVNDGPFTIWLDSSA